MPRDRSILIPIALVIIAGALTAWIVRNASRNSPAGQIREAAKAPNIQAQRPRWTPSPEQQALIDEAENTTPDPLSDQLVSVLAAVVKDYRPLVFYGESDPRMIYLTARSWSLRDGYVNGDPHEVDLFLSILSAPIEVDSIHHERDFALIALQNIVVAGDPHRARFFDFERQALRHVDSPYRQHAIMLLYLLQEQNALSDEGRKTLESWLKFPLYRDQLPRFARNVKNNYFYKQE